MMLGMLPKLSGVCYEYVYVIQQLSIFGHDIARCIVFWRKMFAIFSKQKNARVKMLSFSEGVLLIVSAYIYRIVMGE